MDRLIRRPLLTLEGIAEPYAKNRLELAVQRMEYRLKRHDGTRRQRNARARRNYQSLMPQSRDARRNNPFRNIGPKRKSVDKRRGVGFLRGRAGGMR